MTAAKKPAVKPTAFDSWRTAFIWAYHVARSSRHKTKVAKLDGRWCAWRIPEENQCH